MVMKAIRLSRRGLSDWIVQRLSAVILALYVLVLMCKISKCGNSILLGLPALVYWSLKVVVVREVTSSIKMVNDLWSVMLQPPKTWQVAM